MLIDEGRISSAKIGRDQSYVANIIGMVQISPKIIHAVIRGDYPKTLTLASLKRKLPDLWSEQEAMLLGDTLYWYIMNRSFHQCSIKMQVIPVRGEFCLHFNLIAKQIIFGRWTVLRRICNNPTW